MVRMQPLKRGALMLVGAIIAGASGAYFAERYLDQRAMAIENALRSDYATRSVIVAGSDLPKGTALGDRHVALRDMPSRYLHQQALSPKDWKQINGTTLTTAIDSGEPILPSHTLQEANTRLAQLVSIGDRAITIPANGSAAIAGLLHPGDRLDLMLTHRRSEGEQTQSLLKNVPILATGERTTRGRGDSQSTRYRNLTLAVSPTQAARITHAMAIGEIQVALRGDDDHRLAAIPQVDQSMLMRAANTQQTTMPVVEVIIGGQL